MPMVEYHEEFCRSLQEAVLQPWTSKDTWLDTGPEAKAYKTIYPWKSQQGRRCSGGGIHHGEQDHAADMMDADGDM